ncbi:triose-phosphate isomerase [Spiroplasma endosymbiont of Crioceris asparagi]|uniref:triose-phosphate isomerase n=1 Tax=Spiroplasma endosymbiont of Crioceris asparagi TaxID=3066286 RepID=UPI0030CC9975
MRKKIIIGNWKMYKTNEEAKKFVKLVEKQYKNVPNIIAGIACAPTLLASAKSKAKKLVIAAQNCHFEEEGAFTGETSIPMILDLGVEYVIIGHSERREYFNDTDEVINKKLVALLAHGLTPILCCGESLKTYEKGKTVDFVKEQIVAAFKGISAEEAKRVVIAYEPIWAIGTGKVATPEIAQNVCKEIRNIIKDLYSEEVSNEILIQYGGSVKPENIKDILKQDDIDGALVGGASLEPNSFLKLINL